MDRISVRNVRVDWRWLLRAAICTGLVFFLCVVFCACAGERLLLLLGFDLIDYAGEPTQAVLDAESECARRLSGMLRMLSTDPMNLPEFDGAREAAGCCEEAVLTYMLCTDYARCGGSGSLRRQAEELYPSLTLTTLISASDYEQTLYRSFGGGENVSHRSVSRFTYLPKLRAYTTVVQPYLLDYRVDVLTLEETEHTYRMVFRNVIGEHVSPIYRVIFVKREEGDCFIRACEKQSA